MPLSSVQARWLFGLSTFALVLGLLWVLKPVLMPVAVAILLTFLLKPVVGLLERLRLGRLPAVLLVVAIAFSALGAFGWEVGRQSVSLLEALPQYEANLTAKIDGVQGSTHGVLDNVRKMIERLSKRVSTAAGTSTGTGTGAATGSGSATGSAIGAAAGTGAGTRVGPAASDANRPGSNRNPARRDEPTPVRIVEPAGSISITSLWPILSSALEPLASAALAMVLVIFMLLGHEDMRDRIISVFGHHRLTVTTKAVDEAGNRIGNYLIRQLIINSTFGAILAIGLFFIGVPYALVWGLVAALLRYIPYVGGWIAISLPLAISLVISDSWSMPIAVAGLAAALELLTNMIIEPTVYGKGIGVSQPATLVMMAFWTWLWGPIGLLLGTPMTVCVLVAGKYSPSLAFLDTLLGDEPALTPAVSFYQRVLARDADEALEIARRALQKQSLAQVADALLIPALCSARRDLEIGALTRQEFDACIATIEELGDELADLARAGQARLADGVVVPAAVIAPVPVIVVAVGGGADGVAARLLEGAMAPDHFQLQHLEPDMASDLVQAVQERRAAAVCLVSLPPDGSAQLRLLLRRLRQNFPDLAILVGRWGYLGDLKLAQSRLAQFDVVVDFSLEETLQRLAGRRGLDVSAASRGDATVPLVA